MSAVRRFLLYPSRSRSENLERKRISKAKMLKQPDLVSGRAPFRMRCVLAILFGTGGTPALLAWLAANWSL
ncbi:MAG: hypothetical protein ISN29_03385 [Gammaproteobacteria bacterium AqS3]|nr:hypothetical protein [Gammaproteobacteria bacterium AqS3]